MLNCSVYCTYNCTLSVLSVLSVATISLSYIFFSFLIVITSIVVCLCISILWTSRKKYTPRHIDCIELELPASASNPCRISNGFKGPLESCQTFLTTKMTPLVSSVNHSSQKNVIPFVCTAALVERFLTVVCISKDGSDLMEWNKKMSSTTGKKNKIKNLAWSTKHRTLICESAGCRIHPTLK